MDINQRDLKEQFKSLKFKFENLEGQFPRMVRELIEYYFEQQIHPKVDNFISRDEHRKDAAKKLDYEVFNNYVKTQMQNQAVNEKEFKIEERLHNLERNTKEGVTKEELKLLLKSRASNDRLVEIRENLHKV